MALSGQLLAEIKSYCQILMAFSGEIWAVRIRTADGGSFWPTVGRNKPYCRVLVALSGPRLAVTNRTAESWWLFLANSWT